MHIVPYQPEMILQEMAQVIFWKESALNVFLNQINNRFMIYLC